MFYTLEVLSARPRRWGDHTPTLDQHAYVRRSSDDGATWSPPVCATHYPASCQSQADKVTRLSSGRIIIPCAGFWLTGGDHCVALCFFSDDGGYSWWPSRNFVDVGGATEEPSVVEMEDGRLFMVCRTRRGYLARSHSQDDGLTWSDPELIPELTDPCAGFLATRIPATGDLLVIYCNNPLAPAFCRGEKQQVVRVGELEIALGKVRSPLTSAISTDGGRTWGTFRCIAADPEGGYGDYGYPGITWIDDDQVALVNFHALNGIRVARIGLQWFYGE